MKLRPVRRFALTAAAALTLVPATATVAAAQSPDDLCDFRDQAPDAMAPLIDAFCGEGDGEDDGDGGEGEGGPTGTPLDELCGFRDQAPDEMAPLLDALCGEAEGEAEEEAEDPEPTPTPTPTPEPTSDPDPDVGDDADTRPVAATGPMLPDTGGSLALAGLALLGGAAGLRRFLGTRS
jgi:hypothetical protein